MTSSLRPGGIFSDSMSVTKPARYSRSMSSDVCSLLTGILGKPREIYASSSKLSNLYFYVKYLGRPSAIAARLLDRPFART